MHESPLSAGVETIKSVQRTLPGKPGVYRMLDCDGKVLYVGKAKSLKNRVHSYTRPDILPMRLRRMIAQTRAMEIIETHTELEALLLEFNLIKELNPVYNILLKDDKAFPYILITRDHDFPRLAKHRGAQEIKGDYYGPFANLGAVGRTLNTLQKIFRIRNCTDSFFAARKRPCLQYHIKRCTAPCVGLVTAADYAAQISDANAFLEGKNKTLQEKFAKKMKDASDRMEFEKAAQYRDRIKALTAIQSSQTINLSGAKNIDVFAITKQDGLTCLSVFIIRGGQNFGNKTFFPGDTEGEEPSLTLGRAIIEFYTRHPVPADIYTNIPITPATEKTLLEQALARQAKRKVRITTPMRGNGLGVIQMAEANAESALKRHKAQKASDASGLLRLQEIFDLETTPERIEIYDNSHTSGENMIGAMVVATPEGFRKSAYRKFNIREASASDDYGMMREVMTRRFSRALKEDNHKEKNDGTGEWPDLLLIDGGKGQLAAVTETLAELGVLDRLTPVSISKGPDRNAGREEFHMNGRTPFRLPPDDAGLFYLQRLRDEAHRFAIGSMRMRRAKSVTKSPLDDIPGIGPKRKKALLSHFGSGKAVSTAALVDLERVDGISKTFAKKIYDYFHG